jgi:1,4-alpha-glucan branching enzyme
MGAIPFDSGTTFRVWAPNADRVFVTGTFNLWSLGRNALAREANGYWSGDVFGAKAGDKYKFVIHNGSEILLRTDPYTRDVLSPRDNGVICKSGIEVLDSETSKAAQFEPPALNELVIYELHVGTFSQKADGRPGDFYDVIDRLPYLQSLGINAIELMPVIACEGEQFWGYEPAQPFAVSRNYGGPEGLKSLVEAAHAHGIAIIIDVIYNHLGPWGLDLWQFDGWSENELGGIYFYNDWRAKTPWGHTRPDYGRPEVRQYIRDNVFMWFEEFQVDGLRWDATAYIRNANGDNNNPDADIPEGWQLMSSINEEVKARYPSAIIIAEDLHANPWLTKDTKSGGAGFDSQWDAVFVHPLRYALCAQEDESRHMNAVRNALTFRYNDNAFERVIYTESHDEVANGSTRIPEEVATKIGCQIMAKKMAALGAAILFTTPGIPMIFQGQEFIDTGRFDDLTPLNWQNEENNSGLVKLFQDLISLRRNLDGGSAALGGENIDVFYLNEQDKIIAYRRWHDDYPDSSAIVITNFSGRELTNYPMRVPDAGTWNVSFNSDRKEYDDSFGGISPTTVEATSDAANNTVYQGLVNIGAYSALILTQNLSSA